MKRRMKNSKREKVFLGFMKGYTTSSESTTYYIFYVALHICSKLSIYYIFATYLIEKYYIITTFM